MRSLIEPIVQAAPPGEEQEARIVAGAGWALLACSAGGFAFSLPAESNTFATLLGYVPVVAGISLALAVAWRGHINLAAHVLTGLAYVAVTAAALWTGGLESGAPHVMGVIVVLGAMVLPSRSVIALVLLVVLTLLAFVVAGDAIHAMQLVRPSPYSIVVGPILNACFLGIVVRYVRALYLDSIGKLEEQGRQLDRTVQELERTSVSKDYLDDVLGAVSDMILVTDAANRVIDANPAATQQLDVERHELLGRSMGALLLEQEQEGDDTRTQRAQVLRGDGRLLPVRVSPGQLSGGTGQVAGFVYVLSDVTVEEAAVEAIRRAHEHAETANLAKSQFLANMSHELRTPLNAIIGYAELLEEEMAGLDAAAGLDDLEQIRRAGRDLLVLINGVLDLSKVEAGKMELHLGSVALRPLVDGVLGTIRPKVERKGLELRVNVGAVASGPLHLDEQKVRQILLNLLSNAVKFTSEGCVQLAVATYDRAGVQWVRFVVADSGIGISEAQLDRVFEPFSQADEGHARAFEGTGLGLSISRAFARMMGGEIHVESRLGQGATFRVELPAPSASS